MINFLTLPDTECIAEVGVDAGIVAAGVGGRGGIRRRHRQNMGGGSQQFSKHGSGLTGFHIHHWENKLS